MITSITPSNSSILAKISFIAVCLLLYSAQVWGSTFTSATTGNWSNAATWTVTNGSGTIPGSNDNIVIQSGHTVTINSPSTVTSLTITGELIVNIPSGTLTTKNVEANPSTITGTVNVLAGNLRVDNIFNLTNLLITIDGGSSSVTFGGEKDFTRTTEYFHLNNGGKLIMENLGKGQKPRRQYSSELTLGDVLFPVGTTDGSTYSYTPVYINNRDNRSATINATFSVTVTNGLRSNGTDGPFITSNAVNRTWSVAVLYGDADAEIFVKWNQTNELPNFSPVNSLIALYQDGGWDQFPPTSLNPTTRVSSIAGTPGLTNIVSNQAVSLPKTFPLISIHGNGLNPLPVELTSFNAIRKNSEVALTWETASEKNCKGFEIQTSSDGKKYEAVAFVNSINGNSSTLQRYAYTHKTGNREGLAYYRLKQVDLDGTVSFYHAKVVDLGRINNAVSLFPNPFQESFKLQLQTTDAGKAEIFIKDMTGRTIVHNQPILVKGSNSLDLSLPNVPAGVYLISISTGKENYTNRIVKQ